MPLQDEQPRVGLRERKKAKTRAAIQHHALRLIREYGYAATTVEHIAEAAEVSPSTFFRYFPTKEDVVLQDDFDEALLTAFQTQPPELSPIQAIRGAFRVVFDDLSAEERAEMRERTELIFSVPELSTALAATIVATVDQAAELVATRVARPANDLAVRTFAGALIGAMMAVTIAATDDPTADYIELLDAAMGYLEAGLPL